MLNPLHLYEVYASLHALQQLPRARDPVDELELEYASGFRQEASIYPRPGSLDGATKTYGFGLVHLCDFLTALNEVGISKNLNAM